MNILYGEPFSTRDIAAWSVHCYEVVSGLSRLGHNVILLNGSSFVPSSEGNNDKKTQKLSLLERLADKVDSIRISHLFIGEIGILWNILLDLWTFLLTFIVIVRWRGKLDVIYRRHNLLISQYLLAKLFGICLVTELNGIVVDEMKIRKRGDKISWWVLDKIERINIPKADKIIVVTSRLKEVLQEDYEVPGDKIVMIPNGANTDLFKPMDIVEARRELGLVQSDYYVCWVGVMWQVQHLDCLINSAPLILKELPNTKFLIIGDGVMKQRLISLAEQVGVTDKVIFTGMIAYPKIPLYINASDVCVISATSDARNVRTGASSLKLYEYLACGKPVVVGNVEGISQDVEDSGSGFALESESTDELARAITALLRNGHLRKEMGKRARKVAVEKHSWRKIAEQVAEVCQGVIKDKKLLPETR